MRMHSYTLFDTPLGPCGIAWDDAGVILGTSLPGAGVADTRRRLEERFDAVPDETPPAAITEVVRRLAASSSGECDELGDIPLDLSSLPPFHRRVLEVVRTIPTGETMTYGEVAEAAGSPGAARAVGQALGHNPYPLAIPCHRVLAAGGRIGGFTADGGVDVKAKLLAAEGVSVRA
jgi:methylated-DNA-[protein]-cysteine S-methyltransferase